MKKIFPAPQQLREHPLQALRKQFLSQLNTSITKQARTIEMLQPFNLYLFDEQADCYVETINDPIFKSQLYDPLVRTLEENAHSILQHISGQVDFIDLGPGYPDKSLPLVTYLEHRTTYLRYIPVDINKRFLKIAQDFFSQRAFLTFPLNILFEELPSVLSKPNLFPKHRNRVINLGLTFCNFEPKSILSIYSKLLSKSSIGIIATELIDDNDIERAMRPYKSYGGDKFNFMMLGYLGFRREDFNYEVLFSNGRIEMGFAPKRPLRFDGVDLTSKDRIITSISYRYQTDQLRELLNNEFNHVQIYQTANQNICVVRMGKTI